MSTEWWRKFATVKSLKAYVLSVKAIDLKLSKYIPQVQTTGRREREGLT